MTKIIRTKSPDGMKKLKVALEGLDGFVGKVGWIKAAQYENGTSVAYVAAIQEFGAPERSIPPRPFFRPTIKEKKQAWKDLATQLLQSGDGMKETMTALTLQAENDIAKKITTINSPALSPITLQLRKMRREGQVITGKSVGEAARIVAEEGAPTGVPTTPLRDTMLMFNSLTSEVSKR